MKGQTIKLRIKTRMFLMILPLLVCSFAVSGYITVLSTRYSLLSQSSQFIQYKMKQYENYATRQWSNLEESGLSTDDTYTAIVKETLENYAAGMIQDEYEFIFAVDGSGDLQFATEELEYSPSDYRGLKEAGFLENGGLFHYSIGDENYYGLSIQLEAPSWEIFIMEEAASFTNEIRMITLRQSLSFLAILLIIIIALVLLLGSISAPIKRFRNTIHEIMEHKDYKRQVEIEYPDEIGDLAHDFNTLTSNFDLAYSNLKEYALNEAIMLKELHTREYETLDVLARASDYKDPETAAHLVRVSHYARLLARLSGLDEETQSLIFHATPLHDIGKLGIPDSILLKEGRLTGEEKKIMQTHTDIGFEIMQNPYSKYLKAGAVIAMSHHERFDGSGYPNGLKGKDIPLFGRIVSLVDVFDALTTRRSYKDSWSFDDAVEEIGRQRGLHFDPELVDLFKEHLEDFRLIYLESRE